MNAATLIVAHNTRDDLHACIRSLLESGAPPETVFVADNASEDGTADMLAREFPLVKCIANRRNLLYAAATNQLLALARSDWVLLLNADVLCRYDELVALEKRYHDRPRLAAVAPQLRSFDGLIQWSCRRLPAAHTPWQEVFGRLRKRPSQWKMADFDHRSARLVEQPMFSCLWIRRTALDDVGHLDERYPLFFNDVDWCRRALAKGYEIQFDPSVAVLHKRGGTTSAYPLRKLIHSQRSFARYIWTGASPGRWRVVGWLGVWLVYLVKFPGAFIDQIGHR